MDNCVHLVKLCVGAQSVEDLIRWRGESAERSASGEMHHVTRMWPKRESELLNGGSIYWVIKGLILARQRVIRLDEVMGEDGIRRCALIFDNTIVRTQTHPRRAFQGWRYLQPSDAPADLSEKQLREEPLPNALNAALAEIGVL